MKTKYLLDSVILIDHLNQIEEATQFLQEKWKNCALSLITRLEVLAGYNEREAHTIKLFLDEFTCLPLEKQTVDLAASLRQQHKWKLPDAIQAAAAYEHQLKLVTRNTKDFSSEKHDFVLIPYQI